MSDALIDRKITQDEARRLVAPMELDLIAAFKIIQEDFLTGIADFEGTPEQYIDEIMKKITPGGEIGEKAIIKSIITELQSLTKGKPLPPGTRRQRSDGVYIKQPDGSWLKETEKKEKEEKKDYATKEEMNKLESEVSTKLNIKPENLFVHSTTIDGINDLFEKGQDDYLSVSTFDGSKKFLEKGSETIYFALESEDIKFHEFGDVGWEGGTPRKTTYDEAGLDDWNAKGLIIPPYLKNDKKTIARALIARETILENSNYETDLEIIGVDKDLLNEIDNEIYQFSVENEDLEPDIYFEKLKEKYSSVVIPENKKVEKVCKPKSGEKQNEFISRCIREQRHKGKNEKEAQGMCYGIWRGEKTKETRKTILKSLNLIGKAFIKLLKNQKG